MRIFHLSRLAVSSWVKCRKFAASVTYFCTPESADHNSRKAAKDGIDKRGVKQFKQLTKQHVRLQIPTNGTPAREIEKARDERKFICKTEASDYSHYFSHRKIYFAITCENRSIINCNSKKLKINICKPTYIYLIYFSIPNNRSRSQQQLQETTCVNRITYMQSTSPFPNKSIDVNRQRWFSLLKIIRTILFRWDPSPISTEGNYATSIKSINLIIISQL